MKIKKKALLYEIANMAFVIADTGQDSIHSLHRVKDICEEGNIDRVARILGLAYSQLITILFPILSPIRIDPDRDFSAIPHDYEFSFRREACTGFPLTKEIQLQIKETIHEYMVCMVLSDWLEVTLPEAADVWKFRASAAFSNLKDIVATVAGSSSFGFSRRINPF